MKKGGSNPKARQKRGQNQTERKSFEKTEKRGWGLDDGGDFKIKETAVRSSLLAIRLALNQSIPLHTSVSIQLNQVKNNTK